MPFSKPEKTSPRKGKCAAELCDINQLGLDFVPAPSYSVQPRKEREPMNQELIEVLEKKIGDIVEKYIAIKDEKGKIKLDQMVSLTAAGALSGGFWGSLIGLLFLNPLLGLAVGATAGAVSGALTDVGINDKFMKDLAATLKNGSSVLFVLVRKATPDKVLEELAGTGGTILKTSLSHEDETKLQTALNAAKS